MRPQVFAGCGLLASGVFLPLAFVLEAATRLAGTDGDNAAQSLAYLEQHGTAYSLSGVCLVLAALGILRAATAVAWRTPFLTAVGSAVGGLWAFAGALRISSPGPIGHIRSYDEGWGESAYLAVQMAGTQGGLLAGVLLTEFWIVAGCLLAWRSHALPRPLCVMGMVALVYPLVSVVGGDAEAWWLLAIASLVIGLPAWFIASGLWMISLGNGVERWAASAPGSARAARR